MTIEAHTDTLDSLHTEIVIFARKLVLHGRDDGDDRTPMTDIERARAARIVACAVARLRETWIEVEGRWPVFVAVRDAWESQCASDPN